MQVQNIRVLVLGSILLAAVGCSVENKEHCWLAAGDQTCKELLGGGFCSDDKKGCEGYEVAYGCVFERPKDDACYSPEGKGESCAGPNPPSSCMETAGESGESGMMETTGMETTGMETTGMETTGMETTGMETTGETSETTETSGGAECGDGERAGEEECDDGNQSDNDDCTTMCQNAVCGDGFVHEGEEMCDDGNMDHTDGCKNDCTLTVCGDGIEELPEECDDGDQDNNDACTNECVDADCGDGFVWLNNEQCDDGDLEDQDGCSGTCEWEERIVFVTSQTYNGNLGGLAGADAKCKTLADAANLPGTYKAWISTAGQQGDPASRFNQSTVPYVLVDNTKVADDWGDLVDGTLDHEINLTEESGETGDVGTTCGMMFNTQRLVRTGTMESGILGEDNCDNFTSASEIQTGTVGRAISLIKNWTNCGPVACNISMPIYCFQQ